MIMVIDNISDKIGDAVDNADSGVCQERAPSIHYSHPNRVH